MGSSRFMVDQGHLQDGISWCVFYKSQKLLGELEDLQEAGGVRRRQDGRLGEQRAPLQTPPELSGRAEDGTPQLLPWGGRSRDTSRGLAHFKPQAEDVPLARWLETEPEHSSQPRRRGAPLTNHPRGTRWWAFLCQRRCGPAELAGHWS